MSILSILDEIAATSSRNEKEAIIRKNVGNELLRRVFRMAYDPQLNFYMRKVPVQETHSGDKTLSQGLDYIERMLALREITGNDAKTAVAELLWALSEDDATVLTRVLKKDLRVGCTSDTANKVWKDLVPEYPCLLAQPDKEKTRAKIKFPAVAQFKSDGMRVNAHVNIEDESVTYISRNGKTVYCNSEEMDAEFVSFAKYLGAFEPFDDSVVRIIDGELLWMLPDGTVAPREIGNGKCNKATKGEMSPEDLKNFTVAVWDAIPESSFKAGVCGVKYKTKLWILDDIPKLNFKHILAIPSRVVNSWDEANEWFTEVLAEGGEGLIIKNIDHVWENKRSKDLVKMKAEVENDFEVVGFNFGRGKYEGMIGSYVMRSKCGTVEFNCAGMSDAARAEDPMPNIGKIAAVRYNMIMESKNGEPRRAFLPRLIEIREDKNEADSF